ncbi:MAG TPA: hypothetical protein PK095_25860, partial [Myxococcota bacterium]|nr:hypothetical protein [Myxococcota bacterium]
MVIRVGAPTASSPAMEPGLIDLTPSLPDLLLLEHEWAGGAALQRRLLRVRTGVEPLVPLEDLDDETSSEAAYALVEELRLAVRAAIAPHVERAIA